MIPYELLPHEYSYALYLSYGFDLCPYDPMILNMVSERYPRDEDDASDSKSETDEDDASDSASVCDEDFGDDVPQWLFLDPQDEEDASLLQQESAENSVPKIVFGSFEQDSDLDVIPATPIIPINSKIDGSSIKIGDIECCFISVNSFDNSQYCAFNQRKIGCSPTNVRQLFSDPEMEDKEETMEEAIKNNFSITTDFSVAKTDKKSKVISKEDQTEHHQDPPPQVISRFAVITDLERSLHREMVLSAFSRHLAVFNADPHIREVFSEIFNHSNIKNGDTLCRSRFCTDFVFVALDLVRPPLFIVDGVLYLILVLSSSISTSVSSCLELKNRIIVESCLVFSDLHSAGITTFDPGGTLTEIYYTAVVLMLLSRFVPAANPSRAGVFVFDPGGSCRQPPWISLRTSTFPPAVVLSRKFQKLLCFLSRLSISLHYNLVLFCYCASLKEMAHSMVLCLHFRGILGWYWAKEYPP